MSDEGMEKNRFTLFKTNLVPRAHESFGKRQDTELWNNQFPESKILRLPVSRRMCALAKKMVHRDNVDAY